MCRWWTHAARRQATRMLGQGVSGRTRRQLVTRCDTMRLKQRTPSTRPRIIDRWSLVKVRTECVIGDRPIWGCWVLAGIEKHMLQASLLPKMLPADRTPPPPHDVGHAGDSRRGMHSASRTPPFKRTRAATTHAPHACSQPPQQRIQVCVRSGHAKTRPTARRTSRHADTRSSGSCSCSSASRASWLGQPQHTCSSLRRVSLLSALRRFILS